MDVAAHTRNPMMVRLGLRLQALGVTAFLIGALSLTGLGPSQARPATASPSVRGNAVPCNAICKAYMTWSERITALVRPSRPFQTQGAHPSRPPRMTAHQASSSFRRGMNAFAQFPVQGNPTAPNRVNAAPAAETPPAADRQAAETAPAMETAEAAKTSPGDAAEPRPSDEIADRFPATREFMRALRIGTDGATRDATHDAAESPAVTLTETTASGTGAFSSAGRADVRLVTALLLALCALATLRLFGGSGAQAKRRAASPIAS